MGNVLKVEPLQQLPEKGVSGEQFRDIDVLCLEVKQELGDAIGSHFRKWAREVLELAHDGVDDRVAGLVLVLLQLYT